MNPEGEQKLISSWTTPTIHDLPYYTVLLCCMIITLHRHYATACKVQYPYISIVKVSYFSAVFAAVVLTYSVSFELSIKSTKARLKKFLEKLKQSE